jgi:REP element-mobilizing transposase RayT
MHLYHLDLYVLLSWTTYQRAPFLSATLTPTLHATLASACRATGASPIEIGATSDEVRCLIRVPPSLSITDLAARMKGLSAHVINQDFPDGRRFRWETSYQASSVGKSEIAQTQTDLRTLTQVGALGDETVRDLDSASLLAMARHLLVGGAENADNEGDEFNDVIDVELVFDEAFAS